MVAILEDNKKVVSIFKITSSGSTHELKKLHKVNIPKTSLPFTAVNVRILSNGATLVLGYEFDEKEKIYSYAAVVILFDKIQLNDDVPSFKEIKDVVELNTSEYEIMKEDAEFKVVEHKEL
jgi:hypothetical protein